MNTTARAATTVARSQPHGALIGAFGDLSSGSTLMLFGRSSAFPSLERFRAKSKSESGLAPYS
jgi:hypothetical protein